MHTHTHMYAYIYMYIYTEQGCSTTFHALVLMSVISG